MCTWNYNTPTTNKSLGNYNSSSPVSLSTNTLSITSSLQNISNLPYSSAANIGFTPRLVTSVRFISPTNLTVVPIQRNQCMIIQRK